MNEIIDEDYLEFEEYMDNELIDKLIDEEIERRSNNPVLNDLELVRKNNPELSSKTDEELKRIWVDYRLQRLLKIRERRKIGRKLYEI